MNVGVGPRNPYFARRLGQVIVRKKSLSPTRHFKMERPLEAPAS